MAVVEKYRVSGKFGSAVITLEFHGKVHNLVERLFAHYRALAVYNALSPSLEVATVGIEYPVNTFAASRPRSLDVALRVCRVEAPHFVHAVHFFGYRRQYGAYGIGNETVYFYRGASV